ncbi:MAG: GAF domain-containing protein [Chloroflexi bacterium]|nr:GAF domain-containing protein [Chloroflexota bacterium]MBT7080736.1 GAF domain-containing protein [Chloroflexota bacterium]MBT7290879.1 GAF domain-containing protein [Chloroflexota bacterium]
MKPTNKKLAPIDEIATQLSLADKVSRRVIHSNNAQEVAAGTITDLTEYMSIDWAVLALIDVHSSEVTIKALTSDNQVQKDKNIPLTDTAFEWITKEKQAVFQPDMKNDDRFQMVTDTAKEVRSCIHMPLFYKGAVYGTLSIGSFEPNAYGDAQLKLLKHSVAHLAVSVQSALLLEKNVKTESLLWNISELLAIVTSDPNLPHVFAAFAERLKQVTPFDRLSLALVEGNGLRVIAVHSENEIVSDINHVYPVTDSAVPWMKENRDLNVEADLGQEGQFANDKHFIEDGFHGAIRMPLFNHGVLFATLHLLSVKPYDVNVKLDFLRILSQYLSNPVDSYILYLSEQQRINWLGALAHHLKTPLTPIFAISQMLSDELEKNGTPQQVKMINSIRTGANNMKTNMDLFWSLSDVDSPAFTVKMRDTDMKLFIEKYAAVKYPATDEVQTVKFTLPQALPDVSIDRVKIEQVLDILIEGAMETSPEGSTIELKAKIDGSDVVVTVFDLAKTISEDEKERLVQPYMFSESDMTAFPKLSLHLAICRKLVEFHGGKIWIEPKQKEGNAISFALSIAKAIT